MTTVVNQMRDRFLMDTRATQRLALVLSLCGFALVASAGEPSTASGVAETPATVASCSPAWRLSISKRIEKLENRTSYLEDQVDALEAAVDEVTY